MQKATREQFFRGLKAGVPVMFGFIPVAIAYALSARQAGFSALETILMSLMVYAGSSQMMAVGMLSTGSAMGPIVLATFLLNLRHFIMSTYVMRELPEKTRLPQRLLSAFCITDEGFAVFSAQKDENRTMPFFAGLAVITYLSWVGGSAIGAFASGLIPQTLLNSFNIALYAMFIALLAPGLSGKPKLCLLVLFTAALSALLGRLMPASWALILSTLAGAAVGAVFTGESAPEEENLP